MRIASVRTTPVLAPLARCRALDDEGLEWIEEPVLAEAVRTPIQIGENFNGPREMRVALAARASDLVMPDARFIRGVTGWIEAAALAHAAGVPMSSHTFVDASAHLLCATPTAHWIEVLDAAGALRRAPLQLNEGCVTAWDAPGLGMEWDDGVVARHRI